jgi:hypothetical protein
MSQGSPWEISKLFDVAWMFSVSLENALKGLDGENGALAWGCSLVVIIDVLQGWLYLFNECDISIASSVKPLVFEVDVGGRVLLNMVLSASSCVKCAW